MGSDDTFKITVLCNIVFIKSDKTKKKKKKSTVEFTQNNLFTSC